MNMRAIATKTIAGIALAGALTGIGTGMAAGTASAKPRACAGLDRQMANITIAMGQAAEVEDWDAANYFYAKLTATNKRYIAAGCRS